MNALYTTLIISLLAAVIATVIGTAAAIAIHGMKQKWRTLYSGLTNIPMMNAEIVMGVSPVSYTHLEYLLCLSVSHPEDVFLHLEH